MTDPVATLDRIRAANDEAQELRIMQLDIDAFEIAKRDADALHAKRDPRAKTQFRGSKASLGLVLDGYSIEVVVDLVTRTGTVIADERPRTAAGKAA